MTDKDLLEAAAKAAGIDARFYMGIDVGDGSNFVSTDANGFKWNPLTDDGDALRLAVKLRMCIDCVLGADVVTSFAHGTIFHSDIDITQEDYLSSTRRAIVRAAAEIGRSMKDE